MALNDRLTTLASTVGQRLRAIHTLIDGSLQTVEKVNLVTAINELAARPVSTGSTGYTVVSKSATYTETTTSGNLHVKASGTFTMNLPTAVGNTARITVKLIASGSVTIDGNGTETIDGSLTVTLSNVGDAISIVSDNANWWVV